jgi:pilus assembly protein CpaC
MRFVPRVAFAGSFILVAFAISIAAAQPPPSATGQHRRVADPVHSLANLIAADGRPIVLEVDKGTLVRLAQPASTVFVADPEIADVQVKSPKLIYITAKSPGETVIYAVDAADKVLLNAPVRVTFDLSRLRRSLQQLVPGAAITADSVGANLVLSGTVASAGQAEKAKTLADSVIGEVKGGQVINRIAVATPNQVNLRVLLAEVDRNILKQIGVDWSKVGTIVPGPEVSFATSNNPAPLTNAIAIGMFPSLTGQQISATVSALATEGFLTVLAAPNLTAVSGQTASFLAGGEFPVPIAGTAGTAGIPTITVEFKQYGVQLAFTPTIIDGNHLNLRVRPEVSELTTTGAVSVPITSTSTITIPALTVRRAETTLELGSGQTFALAGLLQNTTEQDISKVPWLGDLPILGALFRSNKFLHNESELVILVTPYLVQPSGQPLSTPVAGLQFPNDFQQVFMSDTYRQKLPAPVQGPLGAGGRGLIGGAGFQLN